MPKRIDIECPIRPPDNEHPLHLQIREREDCHGWYEVGFHRGGIEPSGFTLDEMEWVANRLLRWSHCGSL
jgi:hypothetical protein